MEVSPFEDFKLKLDYLKAQYERLLSRFNYFLTVEMALFGFLGWVVLEKQNAPAARAPVFLGILVSSLWYIVAAGDRALVQEYRNRAEESAKQLGEFVKAHPAKEVGSRWNGPLSWYWRPLSVTTIPVHAAWVSLIVWLLLLVLGPAWLGFLIPTSSQH